MLAYGADIGTILYIASLLVSAALLLSKKKPRAAPLDDSLKSVATQGAYIPLVIGRQRVGMVQVWVDDATPGFLSITDGPGGQPGVGKGSGGVPSPGSYFERGLHALCVGPASEIRAIYQNNEVLWSGSLTPANTPSGSLITSTLEPNSRFRVYWGFPGDPEILYLAASDKHGRAVSYPLCTMILWDPKDLGQSRQWSRLEYEVICPCYSEVATSPSQTPVLGNDDKPSFQDFENAGGTVYYGHSASDPLSYGVSGFDASSLNALVIINAAEVSRHPPFSGDVFEAQFYPIDLFQFPLGSLVKIWVGAASPANFPFTNSPGLLARFSIGEWRVFTVASAVISSTIVLVHEDVGTGTSVAARWMRLELGVEVDLDDPRLVNLNLDPPSLPYTLGAATAYGIVEPIDVRDTDGVNPVHIVDQLLFAKFPYGAARDRSKFNSLSIDVAAEILQSELIRGGIAIVDGQSLDEPLSAIMQDIGLMIPLDPETGLYTFRLLRYGTDGPDLGSDILLEYPEVETIRGDRPIDTVAFTFRDRNRAYREVPVKVIDGGQLQENESQRAQKVPIAVTSDRDSVARIAPRRGQEALGSLSTLKFLTNHQTFLAVPGSKFRCSLIDPGTLFILTEIKRDPDSSRVQLGALVDTYDPPAATSGASAALLLDEPPSAASSSGPASPLEDFFALEVPRGLSSNPKAVSMFLCGSRTSSKTVAAGFWLSRDGLSFYWHGNGPIVVRGELGATLEASAPAVDDGSVPFTCQFQDDASTIEDLTLNLDSWRAGRQVLLIGNEIIFLRNGLVTVAGEPCEGVLSGLIRGRAGSQPQTHAAGTPFLVFLAHRMVDQFSDVFLPGKTLHYKAVGVESRKVEALDGITAKTVAMQGLSMRPPTPSALRLGAFEEVYDADASLIRIDWAYHSLEFPRTGLGNQALGDACGVSLPQGHFVVKIYTGGEEPDYQTTTTSPYFELPNDLRDTLGLDDGELWTFAVVHVEGSFSSGEANISIRST